MSKISLIDNQWVDIVVPPPPEDPMLLWWSLSLVLLWVIFIGAYLLWRRQPRQQLKRKINSLKKNAAISTNPKLLLRQLEKSLCQYCQVTQLSYIDLHHAQWPLFRQQLQQACYQNQTTDPQLTIDLIAQAREIFLESIR